MKVGLNTYIDKKEFRSLYFHPQIKWGWEGATVQMSYYLFAFIKNYALIRYEYESYLVIYQI